MQTGNVRKQETNVRVHILRRGGFHLLKTGDSQKIFFFLLFSDIHGVGCPARKNMNANDMYSNMYIGYFREKV